MNELKVNGINMFINKFDNKTEVINLQILKEQFELDEGETGFYKLSLSEKKVIGEETINENYNRPPIGPIKNNLYCSYCSRIGPEDHEMTCEFPEEDSLYLTLLAFKQYVIDDINYKGDYDYIKQSIKNKTLSQEMLNEILLIPDEVLVSDGSINFTEFSDILTNVSFFGIYKKRGPKKLASKTSTTQFLNNLMIFYEENDHKTSIRVSKNGLINLINVPRNSNQLASLLNILIKKINQTSAVNYDNFNELYGSEINEYTLVKKVSYVHSMSAQFTIDKFIGSSKEINFENLDNLISPYDSSGKITSGPYTTVTDLQSGDQIINYKDIKIIEWYYSLGRLTRNQVMTKEYIKFITNPSSGIKLTGIINKFGTVIMTLSLCSVLQNKNKICGDTSQGIGNITEDKFYPIVPFLNKLFEENDFLFKKSIKLDNLQKTSFNTVSGYAPSGKICRLTRTRDSGQSSQYKEGTRPEPYSWKGQCPDPNYQYLKPQGVQDEDGLWYPCCETKTKDSVERIKNYLITGFPANKTEEKQYNITPEEDKGSGILIPGSNSVGANALVKIDGVFEEVTVIKKLSKKSNEYNVRKLDGTIVKVNGKDFKRDNRSFPGLKDFTKLQLLNCINNTLIKNDLLISEKGNVIKNDKTELNEKYNVFFADLFKSKIKDPLKISPLTYYNINSMKDKSFTVRKCPKRSYFFYLVLSPSGNFYINNSFNSIESQISQSFNKTIVFSGFLLFNDTENIYEYHLIDVLYNEESLLDKNFQERYKILINLQNFELTNIVDEVIVFPDIYSNIIDGSYEIIQNNDNVYLVYVSNDNILVWGDKDNYKDVFPLQIISKNKQEITFGSSNKKFPEGLQLNFLNNYKFNKREIPSDLFINDYFNIKINRDVNNNIVPNRKISIIDKTENIYDYNEIIDILLTKFNPIGIELFSDNSEWILPDDTLVFNGSVLVSSD